MTNSISLFPTEDRQFLRTEKLKVDFRLSYVLLKVVIADSSEIEIKEPNEIIKINLKYITINSISEKYIKDISKYSK